MLVLNNKTKALSQQPRSGERGPCVTPASTPTEGSYRRLEPVGLVPAPLGGVLLGSVSPVPGGDLGVHAPPTAIPTAGMALPALPGPLYLWTRAWAGTRPAVASPPQWPTAPPRARGPHTQWSRRQTRAGSPPRWSWGGGWRGAKRPGTRTGGHCTRTHRKWTGSRSHHRSARRNLDGQRGGRCACASCVQVSVCVRDV